MSHANILKLRLSQRYCGKFMHPGRCEANNWECLGSAVGLFVDDTGRGIDLCAKHEAEYLGATGSDTQTEES